MLIMLTGTIVLDWLLNNAISNIQVYNKEMRNSKRYSYFKGGIIIKNREEIVRSRVNLSFYNLYIRGKLTVSG